MRGNRERAKIIRYTEEKNKLCLIRIYRKKGIAGALVILSRITKITELLRIFFQSSERSFFIP